MAAAKGVGTNFGAIDHRVETALQQADEVFGGVTLQAGGFLVDVLELPLVDIGVIALQLLLGAELNAEIRQLARARWPCWPGRIRACSRGFSGGPDVLAEAAVDLMLCADALGHGLSSMGFRKGHVLLFFPAGLASPGKRQADAITAATDMQE